MRAASSFVVMAVCGLVACAKREGAASHDGAAPTSEPRRADAAGDESDANRRLPLSALNPFPQVRGGSEGEAVVAAAWFSERGVAKARVLSSLVAAGDHRDVAAATLESSDCHALHVGSPAEEGILCQIGYPIPERARFFERTRLLVVRGKAPVKLLDLVLAYVQWDDNSRYVDVALTIAADGQSIAIGDRAPAGSTVPLDVYGDHVATLHRCEDALVAARSDVARNAASNDRNTREDRNAREDLREMTKICEARGSWSWRDGRFAHMR